MRAPAPKLTPRERAAAIKARLTVADIASLREADVTPLARGWTCDCPSCGGAQTVSISADGRTYGCSVPACRATGDVITFEMAASGRSFTAACAALEAAFPPTQRDPAAPDLFNGGGS